MTIQTTPDEQKRIDTLTKFMGAYVSSDTVLRLQKLGFFRAPAAIKHHGNYTGGLFDHSYQVASRLVGLTNALGLPWERERSPYIVGMFHDLCKCDDYVEQNGAWTYNPDRLMNGHGEKSVIMLQSLMPLTSEEILCIRWHMGAFDDKENWQYYSRACHDFPNVLYTHTANMIASQIMGV